MLTFGPSAQPFTTTRRPIPPHAVTGERAMGLTAKELQDAVIERVVSMYGMLSDDIHNPRLGGAVPILVEFLGPSNAAMMILFCQAYQVKFSVYDSGGARVAWPPPEVARLLGEDEGWKGAYIE